MTDTIARNIESVLPFLPKEAGLRAHVVRVAFLAGLCVRFNQGTGQEAGEAELAGLLHHYRPDEEAAGAAKLLSDLGFAIPALPERALAAIQKVSDDCDGQGNIGAAVESANLFDETMENLPYEDLSTADAVQELVRAGMLSSGFVRALQSIRACSAEVLIESLKTVRIDIAGGRWIAKSGGEELLGHCSEVADAAVSLAREVTEISVTEARLLGMFHDVGRVAFQSSEAGPHVEQLVSIGFPLTYAEFLVSGTDHAEVGAELLARRGLPDQLVEAVRYHHRLELTESRLAALVYSAEDGDESLPSCARDHAAAKRLEVIQVRSGRAAG